MQTSLVRNLLRINSLYIGKLIINVNLLNNKSINMVLIILKSMQGFSIRRRSAVDIMKIMTMCGVGIRER